MKGVRIGRIVDARADVIRAKLPAAAIGEAVEIAGGVHGTVQRVCDEEVAITPDGDIRGIRVGDAVRALSAAAVPALGLEALGRAVNARGEALDDGPSVNLRPRIAACAQLLPSQRALPSMPLWSGVKAIDALVTLARGARIGVFGPAGAGKSSLLRLLERASSADVCVVALVGERGREAREWFARLSSRVTIVCASSDRAAAERVTAANLAVEYAARLRSLGLHVLLIVDSLARLAAALREVAVACGEAVGRGGFAPSVFAALARFIESAGATEDGSMTMIASVLSDAHGDDVVGESARALLDGHIVLSSTLAHAGRYPAIDVAPSTSRLMSSVVSVSHAEDAATLRRAICALNDSADARSIGLEPHDPWVIAAQQSERRIEDFLRQGVEPVAAAATLEQLHALAARIRP
ncbi:MAG: EscN/YscN/HrcN family type III secretion system ATPase [Candidatus Eremiobacteraeota bacterium]|nr:EscN/YscN/HrcN family type III secretion system ATPase [Candidatus Eremiobacteraeota bacterium]